MRSLTVQENLIIKVHIYIIISDVVARKCDDLPSNNMTAFQHPAHSTLSDKTENPISGPRVISPV